MKSHPSTKLIGMHARISDRAHVCGVIVTTRVATFATNVGANSSAIPMPNVGELYLACKSQLAQLDHEAHPAKTHSEGEDGKSKKRRSDVQYPPSELLSPLLVFRVLPSPLIIAPNTVSPLVPEPFEGEEDAESSWWSLITRNYSKMTTVAATMIAVKVHQYTPPSFPPTTTHPPSRGASARRIRLSATSEGHTCGQTPSGLAIPHSDPVQRWLAVDTERAEMLWKKRYREQRRPRRDYIHNEDTPQTPLPASTFHAHGEPQRKIG
ncbi:hypothetical protein MSAN_00981000 [Mycena sanguinolenta]|uniref:Uncharacterized protein n=1 Tax=Mycena sanguinolenta TaxID=230812 RepID=A0A8H6YYB5_9AGAR|nr:hypothetical protein MSAN_00981000 [Mycena sanguinolenta]